MQQVDSRPQFIARLAVEKLCGVPLNVARVPAILETLQSNIAGPRTSSVIAITNTESMFYASRNSEHRRYICEAALSLCDGIGVTIAGRFHGIHIPRFNGPVLMEQCCAYGIDRGWRHYFYGGKPGVAPELISRLSARFPGLEVAGWYCPPFRPTGALESSTVLDAIQRSRPDILWVGLGLPKQERWIADHFERLAVPWSIGVGAAFDFHAGTAQWAPPWIQRVGLEWLYRLIHEPRMLSRNIRSLLFVIEAALGLMSRRDRAKR